MDVTERRTAMALMEGKAECSPPPYACWREGRPSIATQGARLRLARRRWSRKIPRRRLVVNDEAIGYVPGTAFSHLVITQPLITSLARHVQRLESWTVESPANPANPCNATLPK